jgi:hypothetical protein
MPFLKRISKVNMNFIRNKYLASTTFDLFAKIVHNRSTIEQYQICIWNRNKSETSWGEKVRQET